MAEELTGRELDAAVAEKLFGWKWWTLDLVGGETVLRAIAPAVDGPRASKIGRHMQPATGHEPLAPHWDNWWRLLPAYSTTWKDMRLVAEEMERRGWYLELYSRGMGTPGEWWDCHFWGEPAKRGSAYDIKVGSGATAPEAVARAALKALEASDANA